MRIPKLPRDKQIPKSKARGNRLRHSQLIITFFEDVTDNFCSSFFQLSFSNSALSIPLEMANLSREKLQT